jgi:hypothetical protein
MLASRGSGLLAAKLYASSPTSGVRYCVIATCLVYALILAVIPWIRPHRREAQCPAVSGSPTSM